MNKALLVRIFTPVLDPKNQEKPGQLGECGTGYPVGPDLVLTAWHVVFPTDRDLKLPIEVRWHSHPNATAADGWFVLKDEDIVWQDEQLDAALLRCPRPEAARGFGYVSDQRPRTGHSWESAGFPRVARYEKVQHAEPFRGEMNSLIEGEGHFTIDVTAPPRNDEDWSGASGMPVFRQGTSIILGLVKQVPQGFGSQRLHVTPCFRLLESQTFRQAIGHDVREQRRGQVEADLASLLASSGSAAIKSILEHTQLCCDLPPELSERSKAAAVQLLQGECTAIVHGLHLAHSKIRQRLRRENATELHAAAKVIEEVAQLLAPYLYDAGVTGAIRLRMERKGLEFWVVPCVLPTVAEIIMAGADGRQTDYLPRETDEDYPHGRSALPAPPEVGISPGWEAQAQSVREAIAKKFCPGGWNAADWEANTRPVIDDFLYVRFAGKSGGTTRSNAARIRAAARELKTSAIDNQQSYYLFLPLPQEEPARTQAEEALRELGRDYPALAVLGYEDDEDQENRDREAFGPFARLLPKRS